MSYLLISIDFMISQAPLESLILFMGLEIHKMNLCWWISEKLIIHVSLKFGFYIFSQLSFYSYKDFKNVELCFKLKFWRILKMFYETN